MTAIATGGFSIHADSIGHYGSPLIEYAVVPVMVAGSIAFPIHYLILNGSCGTSTPTFRRDGCSSGSPSERSR